MAFGLAFCATNWWRGGINDSCEPSLGLCASDGNFGGDGNCFALVFEVVLSDFLVASACINTGMIF